MQVACEFLEWDSEFFGVRVKRAFIITSKRQPVATVK